MTMHVDENNVRLDSKSMKCFLLDVFFQLSCSTVCIKQDSKWEDFAFFLMYHCHSTGKLNASLHPYLRTYKYIRACAHAPTQILFSVSCTFYKALLVVKHLCIKFKFTWSVSNISNMISFVVTICHATTKVIFYLQQKGKKTCIVSIRIFYHCLKLPL